MTATNVLFGWKTSITNWNDDSVWANAIEPWPGPWQELRRWWQPPNYPSIDLAFRLAAEQMVEGIKWSQPPEPYTPTNIINGWDEWSIYGSSQIVADDWVCTSTNPVTDIHWWGSFLNWCQAFPPQIPDAFHITIWTDVPTNATNFFSHPGVVIWETHCTNFTYEFAGYDFDPRRQGQPYPAGPETCFQFTQELTEAEWFHQNADLQTNIYWVSIAAVYANQNYQYPWGWKSRPRDTNFLAPDDAVRILRYDAAQRWKTLQSWRTDLLAGRHQLVEYGVSVDDQDQPAATDDQ